MNKGTLLELLDAEYDKQFRKDQLANAPPPVLNRKDRRKFCAMKRKGLLK